jgi:mono/diheme cytochrome c family protein
VSAESRCLSPNWTPTNRLRLLAAFVATAALAVPLGSSFPDERIIGPHGEMKHLSDFWQAGPLLLVPLASCQAQLPKVEDPRISVLGIAGQRCNRPAVFFAPEGAPASALLLDTRGSLRRVFRAADSIPADVRAWFDGMAVYRAQCARCHGDDGADTGYPGIRVLSGIGNRHSEGEILEMTQRAGFVDLHALDDKARRALADYVAGL